jgi:hypothetical protein
MTDTPTEFTYDIGGKRYVQRPLVLGQWRQLIPQLTGLSLPADPGVEDIILAIGDGIEHLAAVVITEEGASPRDKDITALAAELEFALTPETAVQIADDFFACNPLQSVLEKLAAAAGRIAGAIPGGSTISPSSSPEGTSPGGTGSSGDSPPSSASPGHGSGDGTGSSGKP